MNAYEKHWREYRRRRFLAYGFAAAWLPFGIAMMSLQDDPTIRPYVLPIVLAYMFLGFGIAGLRLSFWPCPRCGRPFSLTTFWRYKHFNPSCRHCGLPKWAPCDPASGGGDA